MKNNRFPKSRLRCATRQISLSDRDLWTPSSSFFFLFIHSLSLSLSLSLSVCISTYNTQNQSTNQPTNQPTNQSTNQYQSSLVIDRSANRPARYDTKNVKIEGSRRRRPSKFCTRQYERLSLSLFFLRPINDVHSRAIVSVVSFFSSPLSNCCLVLLSRCSL